MLRPDRMEPCLFESPCQITSHYCCLPGIVPSWKTRLSSADVCRMWRISGVPLATGHPKNNLTIWIRGGITARPLITACISPLWSALVNSSDCALNKVISVKCQRQEGKAEGRHEQKQSRKVTGDNWGRNGGEKDRKA